MQRNSLLFGLTFTLANLTACGEDPRGRLFDFWESVGDGADGSQADETGASDDSFLDDDTGESDSGDGDPGDGGPGDGDGDGDDDDDGDEDAGGDAGDGGDEGEGDGSCVAVSEGAELVEVPVDIIFIVDNSEGMSEESILVQIEMNGFAAKLEQNGIDYHIILISSYPGNGNDNGNDNGICIHPPLGSGSCPNYDDNFPLYTHVDEKIGSHNALAKLISTQMQWKDSIRPDSMKHIVVVSDDESELGPNPFSNQFSALGPGYDSFMFHAIVCPWDCPESDAVGQVYVDLVNETGGVLGDLCQQDFHDVFDELAKAMSQDVPLTCQFDIPPPPLGMNLDPNLVNVELDDGNNNLEEIPNVGELAECMNYPEGWYYDDPVEPAQIFLCPQTCAKAQGYTMGSINVEFGCQTLMPQ